MAKKKGPLASERAFTDAQLKAIGCVVLESTKLEKQIDLAISKHANPLVLKTIGEQGISFKAGFLRAVLMPLAADPSERKVLSDLHSEIASAVKDRNVVVHGAWDDPKVTDWYEYFNQFSPKRDATVSKGDKNLPASALMGLADHFGHLQERLESFLLKIPSKPNT